MVGINYVVFVIICLMLFCA
jgi:hypothetical protein